ncbi:MAG TPA: DUF1698 domain-containing protein [Thermoanaerobaculia bacterium]|nr:DUF1698 domain-containing protein [Thermoanaerobaculia bacterium]
MAEDARSLVESVPFWWHSIDLGGMVTSGAKSPEVLRREWEQLRLPELRGKTLLDINTFDGFFAFEAEKRGASVTVLDFYMWAMELPELVAYWKDCRDRGVIPAAYDRTPHYKPDELPGKRGFDVAHRLLGSSVKEIVADFMTVDLQQLGTFDVVLFLGSLYHMENPLESMKRVAAVTRELAVIETEAVRIPGYDHRAFVEFFESNELNGDVSNWWAPNERALAGMCRAAGFSRVETYPGTEPVADQGVERYRLMAKAWK